MKSVAILVLNDFVNDARVVKEAHSLAKDYRVTVFALNPGGQPVEETLEGDVRIYRLTSYGRDKLTGLLRKAQQALVYIQYFFTFLRHASKFDVVHCNDLETLPMGVVSRLLARHIRIVYDAHEYETETQWMRNPVKKWLARKLERWCIRYADRVCVVSNGIRDEYKRLYDLDGIELVLNAPNLIPRQESENLFRRAFDIDAATPIFLYQGGFTGGRGIEMTLEAFADPDMQAYAVVFMGSGALEGRVLDYAGRFANIYLHDAVPQKDLLRHTASADYGILFYEDTCLNHRFCSPNKMFEYVMACLPVVVSDLEEMARFVRVNEIGVAANQTSGQGLIQAAKKILELDSSHLDRALVGARAHYNWEAQEKVLREMYASLGASA